MKKIHRQSGEKCLVCETPLDSEFITLHKTRRQTHRMCLECFNNYINTLLPKIKTVIRKNCRKDIHYVPCTGSYQCHHKNQCKYRFSLLEINIPESLPIYNEIIKIRYVLSMSNVYLCPNDECSGILEIDSDYPFNNVTCHNCNTTWCRQCSRTPYHKGQTCLEAELSENKEEGAQFINEQIKEGLIKLCPGCKSPIYRPSGCNKMTCEKCGVKFCWLCGECNIDYSHYNVNRNQKCSNRLWEGTVL